MRQPSNWVSAVITLVCGGLLGLLATVAHRASWTVAGWPAPIGLILGAIAAVAFVGGCRLLWESRIPAVGAALGVLLAQGVVTLVSGAGAFYDTTTGFDGIDALWTFVPAVLVAAIVVWPARRASEGVSARG